MRSRKSSAEEAQEHEPLDWSRKQDDEEQEERHNEHPIAHVTPPPERKPQCGCSEQPSGQECDDSRNARER